MASRDEKLIRVEQREVDRGKAEVNITGEKREELEGGGGDRGGETKGTLSANNDGIIIKLRRTVDGDNEGDVYRDAYLGRLHSLSHRKG